MTREKPNPESPEYGMSADELNQHLTAALNDQAAEVERLESERDRESYLARHDSRTEIPNLRLFEEVAIRKASAAERRTEGLTFLNFDLQGLKRLNDQISPQAGHEALKRFADALAENCRETDLAARVGGDEFFVILESSDAAEPFLERLDAMLDQPEHRFDGLRLNYYVGEGRYAPNGADYSPDHIQQKVTDAMNDAENNLKRNKEEVKGAD